MTIEQIDKAAKQKKELKADCPTQYQLIQLGLYYRLRQVYNLYDAEKDTMTVEEAKALKDNVIQQYEEAFTAISERDRLIRQNEDLLDRLEQHTRIFKEDDRRRVKMCSLFMEAEKNGCEICKKIVRAFDGRLS